VTTTSGTTAIFAALVAAGVTSGDEVLVPDVTFIATANAVSLAGATPVLVDVERDTLSICPAAAARAITPKTRAIIPVHISGRAADMSAILELARAHKLRVIEDAAEALGSRWTDGRALGSIGDAGCFSFSPNKIITTGQGGAVATNDDGLAGKRDDLHSSVGYNFKFTNIQAAVGLGQLELIHARHKRMLEIYRNYVTQLRDVEQLQIIGFVANELPLWIDVLCTQRDELDAHLKAHGISGRKFWHPLHTQVPYRRPDAEFPAGNQRARQAYWLPSSFMLRNEQIDFVCDQIKSFYSSSAHRAEAA
jgi:perosamine synthetase